MAAQHQTAPATSKVTAIGPQPRSRSVTLVDPSIPSVELRQLYQMRADALAWLRSLDERILAHGGVIVTETHDGSGDA